MITYTFHLCGLLKNQKEYSIKIELNNEFMRFFQLGVELTNVDSSKLDTINFTLLCEIPILNISEIHKAQNGGRTIYTLSSYERSYSFHFYQDSDIFEKMITDLKLKNNFNLLNI